MLGRKPECIPGPAATGGSQRAKRRAGTVCVKVSEDRWPCNPRRLIFTEKEAGGGSVLEDRKCSGNRNLIVEVPSKGTFGWRQAHDVHAPSPTAENTRILFLKRRALKLGSSVRCGVLSPSLTRTRHGDFLGPFVPEG